MASRLNSIALRTASIAALLLVWAVASRLMNDPEVLPGPLVIGATIAENLATDGPQGQSAFFHIGITLARIFVTFGASMLAGIGIGLAMALSRTVERALIAVIPLMLTIPTILMVFLAVMWFGFSEAGGLVAVMAVVTPYVTVNVFEGAKAMDKSLIDMALTFKADRVMRIRQVYLPQLMPYIFSAFRYAFGVTWKYGIGYMFFFWFGQFNMVQVMAWVVTFVILMLILEHGVFARLEHRAFAWRRAAAS
jgi:NitT/TauT family transport system permease protein